METTEYILGLLTGMVGMLILYMAVKALYYIWKEDSYVDDNTTATFTTLSKLKIFAIHVGGEIDWVAAYTNIHAMAVYEEFTENSPLDLDDTDYIVEVPRNEWNELKIMYDEYEEDGSQIWITFEEYMKNNYYSPELICSTAY